MNSHSLWKKQENLRYFFIYKNMDTFRYAIFREIFDIGIFIQNHDTLRYVTFLIQNAGHFAKIKTRCVTFLNKQKSLSVCVTQFFIEFLKLAKGGRACLETKNIALCLTFYMIKNALSVPFLYTETRTLCVTF